MSRLPSSVGIQRIASLHVFVRDLGRVRDFYVERLDFPEIARSTPDFEEEHRARASVVEAGGARFVFMEPLGSRGESFAWLQRHPEGVGRIVFDVEDAERAFALLTARGATPMTGIERREVEGGTVVWFDIATIIGDTQFRFVQHKGRTPILPDLERLDPPRGGANRFRFTEIDHVTSNFLTLRPAIRWFEEVLGLEECWTVDFHTQDVRRGIFNGTGLRSVVLWDPESGIKFANNEPAAPSFRTSQIYLFCEDHGGPGIQHVAIETHDILQAVRGLRDRGVEFMPTPGTYYDDLPARLQQIGVRAIDEKIEELRKLEILVDGSAEQAYLLQIFLREHAALFGDRQAGPFFLEVIQRKGDKAFGTGNFRALFDSIERQQQVAGRRPDAR